MRYLGKTGKSPLQMPPCPPLTSYRQGLLVWTFSIQDIPLYNSAKFQNYTIFFFYFCYFDWTIDAATKERLVAHSVFAWPCLQLLLVLPINHNCSNNKLIREAGVTEIRSLYASEINYYSSNISKVM